MSTIILYIYLVSCIMVYIFIQLNYMFLWFEKLMPDNAFDSLFWGIIFSLFWPLSILVYPIVKIALIMDDVHHKHKYK
jgi:hypothetical protein